MLKHIVMWKLADNAEGRTKEENLGYIRERLLALRPIIPEIRSMELGRDELHSEMSYDMALVMEFDDIAAMKRYKVHPDHVAVSEYVKKVRIARTVVDYTV